MSLSALFHEMSPEMRTRYAQLDSACRMFVEHSTNPESLRHEVRELEKGLGQQAPKVREINRKRIEILNKRVEKHGKVRRGRVREQFGPVAGAGSADGAGPPRKFCGSSGGRPPDFSNLRLASGLPLPIAEALESHEKHTSCSDNGRDDDPLVRPRIGPDSAPQSASLSELPERRRSQE
jgi:hypothetical protein